MSAPHYYNEYDEYAAQWLRNLMAAKLIPSGVVDSRSIVDVEPDDLRGFTQCHFFAGIGGWALAARLAGWPVDRELWTGSCPCQPFSDAGKGHGLNDERHLWPHQLRLIGARRPAVWMGEQVAAAIGKDWLDGVLVDVERIDYSGRAVVIPACAVDGPHRRDRIWIAIERNGLVGDSIRARLERLGRNGNTAQGWALTNRPVATSGCSSDVGYADQQRIGERRNGASAVEGSAAFASPWSMDVGDSNRVGSWAVCHDGKVRRVEPSIPLLADGVPSRVGRLRAYGNAIVPQVAAEVIAAYLEYRP